VRFEFYVFKSYPRCAHLDSILATFNCKLLRRHIVCQRLPSRCYTAFDK